MPNSREESHIGPWAEENAGSASVFNRELNFSMSSQSDWEASFSRGKGLQYSAELPEPARSRLAAWAETQHNGHIFDITDEPCGLSQAVSSLQGPLLKQGTETWTSVTDDVELVQHLLALYFCWEYPTFASLSKEQFLRDFSDGRPRYCSSLLVNALLALGCRLSNLPVTKADPEDPYSSGQQFFDESIQLLRQESDYHSLLTIQTLGILSIREASCGRVSESMAFSGQSMRLAVEMGLHNMVEHPDGEITDEFTVQSATYWGAFALEQ